MFDGSQPCAQSMPDAWFPTDSWKPENRTALRLCHSCPFREPCLDYALDHKVEGIWGGTTAPQRRQINRLRERTAA